HKKAGIAAVYFVTPDSVATITTAGAVHAWELSSKKMLGEFVPVKGAPPGKVAAGKSAARSPDRQSVAVAVGGTIFDVVVKGGVTADASVEVGEVGRSLGLALSGNGKLLYVFETLAEPKAEKGVVAVPAGGKGKSTFYRLPAEAGDAVFAGWASDDIGVVGSAKGQAVWLEQSEERFVPLALLTPLGEVGLHATGER